MSHTLAAKQAKLVKALFECMPAFPLSHACIVRDLTTSTGSVRRPIVTIDRACPLGPIPPPFPNGKGASRLMGLVTSRSKATCV